jgi:hypothetical protein
MLYYLQTISQFSLLTNYMTVHILFCSRNYETCYKHDKSSVQTTALSDTYIMLYGIWYFIVFLFYTKLYCTVYGFKVFNNAFPFFLILKQAAFVFIEANEFSKYIKHQYILPLLSVSCQSVLVLIN